MASDFDDDDDRPRGPRRRPRPKHGGTSAVKVMLGVAGGIALIGCLGIGGCVMLLGVGARKQAEKEREVAAAPAISIAADALHAEYHANEVAADGKYKGKVVEVTGTVKEIGKGAFGGQYVALTLDRNRFMTSVRGEFPASAQNQLAKLAKGQQVTIRGKCDGFISAVRLENCSLK